MPKLADPAPLSLLADGPTAVLLLHGFTGSAAEMKPLARRLHQQGYSVEVPLLRGHGSCVEDLEPVLARDWTQQVSEAIDQLEARGKRVVVGGLSLGAMLALEAGLQNSRLEGLLLFSPPIAVRDRRRFLAPLLRLLVHTLPKPPEDFVDPAAGARFWGYGRYPVATSLEVLRLIARVRRQLRRNGLPLRALVVLSHQDRVVRAERSMALLQRWLDPARTRFHWLEGGGHVLTIDGSWPELAELTLETLRNWEVQSTKRL
ncbi:carboxylesterase [Cyanobium sp. NIES-981]|uniref:alpha/beta hydrolase n=1 Tax=Cyanobium sp. NIES-981 TaxID=1851505 RepID=UPI0007DDA68B|nr:alpha/beta fold hydrolase [Cyanobium sp. NIES-981]SBO42080.1 Thermostable monoacylglycerol lipase [Cyanobium sp. NIES-981]